MHCPKLTRVCVLSLLFAVSVHVSKGELQINECNEGWVDFNENSQSIVTCTGYDQQYIVQWIFRGIFGANRGQFTCQNGSIPCVANGPMDGSLAQRFSSATTLTITNNHRVLLLNRRLECSGYVQGAATSVFCDTNVISPAVISNCSVSFESQTWIVSGTCYFADTYSTNDTYYCSWIQKLIPSGTREIPGVINKTSYIKTNKLYYNGTCSFTTQIAKAEGVYSYSMRFYPTTGITPIDKTFLIDSPGPPVTNCSDIIQEGAGLSCTCLQNPVSGLTGTPPPAYFQWHGFPAGPTLTLFNVTRQLEGQVYTCKQFWGPPSNSVSDYDIRTVNLTLNVAYGPDSVSVSQRFDLLNSGSVITLECRARNFHPSVNFTWAGVTCSNVIMNQDVSSCTIFAVPADDGKEVTCTADNIAFPDRLSRRGTVNIRLNYSGVTETTERGTTIRPAVPTTSQQTLTETSNSSEISSGGYIAIGIVIGVAVSALVVAAGFLIRWFRWRQIYDRPTPRNRRTDEHTYTDMTVYEQVGGARTNAHPTVPEATSAATHEYENSQTESTARASYVNTAYNVDAANPYDN